MVNYQFSASFIVPNLGSGVCSISFPLRWCSVGNGHKLRFSIVEHIIASRGVLSIRSVSDNSALATSAVKSVWLCYLAPIDTCNIHATHTGRVHHCAHSLFIIPALEAHAFHQRSNWIMLTTLSSCFCAH